ncbi:profilin 1 L homeolog [Xenopus laevis]|uniref:Profilin n=2 Tax=Xenopus laevis TaxID=8355 RepID=Q3KQ82_XENLA|nr:profilin 1 L homeolog [Xenopus laevis]AAI06344.1 MGC130883 protein [Xenopus laevis]OCT90894.1 hypothetical protein XELAEV_18019511mg [Xenopus laevis]
MSGWNGYVDSLTCDKVQEACICGYKGTPSVWACTAGGTFNNITASEISALVSDNREKLFVNGLTLAGMRCSVLRDEFAVADNQVMDLRTKNPNGPTFNISICKTEQALVIVMGKAEVHGGCLNKKVFDMGKYLRCSGY